MGEKSFGVPLQGEAVAPPDHARWPPRFHGGGARPSRSVDIVGAVPHLHSRRGRSAAQVQGVPLRLPHRRPGVETHRLIRSKTCCQQVRTRRGIMCAHREPAYVAEPWSCGQGPGGCGCEPGSCRRLRESEQAQDRAILLPLYHQMREVDQERVAAAVRGGCVGRRVRRPEQGEQDESVRISSQSGA